MRGALTVVVRFERDAGRVAVTVTVERVVTPTVTSRRAQSSWRPSRRPGNHRNGVSK